MSTINRLSSVDVLQPSDQIPVWDSSNGDTRKASMSTLLAFVESYFADPDYSTRIVAPAVDYFTVDIGATGDSIWMIVNPVLNFTTGTITLPSTAYAVNDQEITVVFTAAVINFSITSSGATVLGAPVSINGYDSFRVRYNASQQTWYTLDTTGDGTGGVSQITRQDFTGNGTTTTFTLTTAPSALGNELQIFIDGVYQERSGYAVTGSNVVFSEAPPSLSTIEVLGWSVTIGAESSADLVSYTPAGTGAVVTTVQTKLREAVSVKDFGATGDGSTDDYAAILAALDAMPNGGKLYFPPGTYIVGTAVPLRHGVNYYGDNAQSTIVKAANGSWDNVLGLAYGGISEQYGITIEGLTFDGNKENTTENENNWIGTPTARLTAGETITSSSGGSAILAQSDVALTKIVPYPSSVTGTFNVGDTVTGLTSGNTMVIASKTSDDAFQICIRSSSLTNSIIRDCRFINSVFTALSLYNLPTNVLVEKNFFVNNNKTGLLIPSPYQIHVESNSNIVTIRDNVISNSLGTGINVRGGGTHKNIKIVNNTVGNTANYGISVINATSGTIESVLIAGNRLYSAPNGAPESIFVDGTSGTRVASIVISDNTVELAEVPIAVVAVDGATVSGNVFNECNSGATVDLIRVLGGSTNVFVNGNSKTTNTVGKLSERSAFLAQAVTQADATGDGTIYTVQFATEIQDYNSDFDGVSTFTAPVTGMYEFTTIVSLGASVPSATTLTKLALVTSNRTYDLNVLNGGNEHISNIFNLNGSMIVDMDAGDTASVTIALYGGTKIADVTTGSYFSGRLLTNFT